MRLQYRHFPVNCTKSSRTYFAEDLQTATSETFFVFQNIKKQSFNSFQANGSFRYPLKALENQKFSDVVRGSRTETSACRGRNKELEAGPK